MEKILTASNYEVIPLDTRTNVRFYTSYDPGSYVPPHWHDAIEIVYLLEGHLKLNIEGTHQELQEGQCTLIQPNKIHSTLCTQPNRAIVFQIPQALMEKFIPEASALTFSLDFSQDQSSPNDRENRSHQANIAQFRKNLEEMKLIMDTEPDGALLLFNGLLFHVLYQLYHDFSQNLPGSADTKQSRNLQKLKPVLDYINANYNRSISLAEISGVAMFDSKYFCRFFKKCMGTTFLEYQNEIRISHIYQDLISTDDKIAHILERHGFTNYKLFRRMFQEHFGTTPSAVRIANTKRRTLCTF